MLRSRFRAANRSFVQQLPWRSLPADVSFAGGPLLQIPTTTTTPSPHLHRNLRWFLNARREGTWPSMDPIIRRSSLECLKLQRQHFMSFGDGDGDEDTGLSKQHEESRVVGYSPEQLFAVVAAVDLYQDFVPWCQKSTVLWRKDEAVLEAELEVGFKFFVERYISHVELKPSTLVKSSVSQSNLFEYLINVWEFKPGPTPGSCNLHFSVSFQFRSPLYRQVANMFFEEVVSRLVSSFEDRCNTVYGPSVKILDNTQAA